jgi:hypothetical protein
MKSPLNVYSGDFSCFTPSLFDEDVEAGYCFTFVTIDVSEGELNTYSPSQLTAVDHGWWW